MVPIHLFNIQNFFLILYMCTHLVSKTMSVTLCTHFGFPNFKNIFGEVFPQIGNGYRILSFERIKGIGDPCLWMSLR